MMDTIKSFKGYGKVDPAQQHAFAMKTRRRFIIMAVSAVFILALVVGVAVGTTVRNRRSSDSAAAINTPSQSLKAVCSLTRYPDTCISALSNSTTADPAKLFLLSLHVAVDELSKLVTLPPARVSVLAGKANATRVRNALRDCADVFSDAVDCLKDSISSSSDVGAGNLLSSATNDNLKTWLSAALTDQETCIDGLMEITGAEDIAAEIRSKMIRSSELISNSLAIVTKLFKIVSKFKIPFHRRLLRARVEEGYPGWVRKAERRLLEEAKPTADAVVAKDGSGNFTTVGAAVAAAPVKSEKRFVIYIKEGKYVENVAVPKKIWNVMMYGDGMTKTVISGSLNFMDGTPTYSTGTFVVQGKGFIAKDLRIENTAGAAKHQAVAFRSGSDESIFHRCMFDGYQDTLYAHSNRQFYLGCTITGTVDFIFGNAAVVFQDCSIQPRQPLPNQFNTITAQGKKDPNQNTGISIQKCTIAPLGTVSAPTYLGRPWKEFSTTVVMQSTIESLVHPVGWIEWVSGVEPPSSIFYGEYENGGPGADVSKRVKWVGYQPNISVDQARKYTVDSFIDGSSWLGTAGITYESTL